MMDVASQAGMTLGEQRDARNALTQLLVNAGSEQSEWEGLITAGLVGHRSHISKP